MAGWSGLGSKRMKAALVLGAGDVGSAVAHALHSAGFAVAIADGAEPAHPRRGMAFADAFWDGSAELAGLRAVLARDEVALGRILDAREAVTATSLPAAKVLAVRPFAALVDARMRKRAVPPDVRGLTPLSVGLGPGFVAGVNCDVAVETSWEALGQVVHAGATLPLRGEPRPIDGIGRERALYAPQAGLFRTARRIGDTVAAGAIVAELDGLPLRAPLAGVLRGLVRDGVRVAAGAKVVEVDPRGDPRLCFGIGERPGRIASAVRAVLLAAAGAPAAPTSRLAGPGAEG